MSICCSVELIVHFPTFSAQFLIDARILKWRRTRCLTGRLKASHMNSEPCSAGHSDHHDTVCCCIIFRDSISLRVLSLCFSADLTYTLSSWVSLRQVESHMLIKAPLPSQLFQKAMWLYTINATPWSAPRHPSLISLYVHLLTLAILKYIDLLLALFSLRAM